MNLKDSRIIAARPPRAASAQDAAVLSRSKVGRRWLPKVPIRFAAAIAIFANFAFLGFEQREPQAHPLKTAHTQPGEHPSQSEQTPANDARSGESRLNPELAAAATLIVRFQTDAARQQLQHYLNTHPDDGKALFLFGMTYHREKKYGQALSYFDRSLKLAPDYLPINHFRGWALYYLGELDESRQAFEEFLKTSPDEPDSHFALGLIDLDEQDLDQAKSEFEKSISTLEQEGAKADPKALSKAHARLSEVYEQRDDLKTACEHLEIAARLFPDHYEALYKLNRIYLRLGETAKAQAAYQQFLAARERLHPGTSFPE
jgi:tetratricopeptide (TPR) repeat protein